MKKTLRARYTLILVFLMTFVITATVFVNQFCLSSFYMARKQKSMELVYHELNEMAMSETLSAAESEDRLISLGEKYNISLLVMQDDSQLFLCRKQDEKHLANRLLSYVFGSIIGLSRIPDSSESPTSEEWEGYADLQKMIIGDRISQTENYEVYKAFDPAAGAYYMEFWGSLANNYLFLMRTPVQSITESVAISNQFYLYVGICAVLVGALVMYLATRRLTKPILNLSSIAEKMSRLDFTARYTGTEHDEIDLLGDSMNRMSEQLEKTISELKAANLELQQDLERRNQMDEMRNEFISGVSHELKTPIALIQGYAEGLKEGVSQDPESMDFYCDVIMDEADRMNRMVKKMLTLNQIEYGSEALSVEHFDVTVLIRGLLQPYQRIIQQNGIQVIFDEPAIYVWADEFMIEEVIGNYLSNAFHYVKGENRIEIRLEQKEETVRISVFNTGDPIPEEFLGQVWQKFYKVDKARSREYGGNGIGLSIVKAIMDKHQKPCGVCNRENGVEFWIELDAKSN